MLVEIQYKSVFVFYRETEEGEIEKTEIVEQYETRLAEIQQQVEAAGGAEDLQEELNK